MFLFYCLYLLEHLLLSFKHGTSLFTGILALLVVVSAVFIIIAVIVFIVVYRHR